MKLGILSDTHDRLGPAAAGIKILRDAGAEMLIHCGDVGGEQILDLLVGIPSVFVFGNNDWDHTGLARYAKDLGIDCRGHFGDLRISGKRIAVTHGDDSRKMVEVISSNEFDYLLHGHTHIPRDQRLGKLRIINPGALHRAARKTVAMLDLATDDLKFWTIEGENLKF